MEDYRLRSSEKGKVTEEMKYHPSMLKDVKRRLSRVNKKINDLHHQRKFLYKNSVKVKKMIHNQVNQIVKCLRARERCIWSEVDEAYMLQDANITDELSRLQSAYARCQVFFNHIEDLRGKTDVMETIHSIFQEVNSGEKTDTTFLEFVSDFEEMKIKANCYGHLERDFIKKDYYTLISERKDSNLLATNFKQSHCKEEVFDKVSNFQTETSKNFLEKDSTYKMSDCEDFEVIDLLENISCHDPDDFIMADEESVNCSEKTDKELSRKSTDGNKSQILPRMHNSSELSYKACEDNQEFNPEEEWKQILEMNKKMASFYEMSSLSRGTQTQQKIEKTLGGAKTICKLHDKNCEENRFLLLKDSSNWLSNSKPEKDTLEKISLEIDSNSSAELIKRAFKPYFAKTDVQNWLLLH